MFTKFHAQFGMLLGTYVANASGQVPAVIESVGKIVAFEMKILNWLNIPINRVVP